jgi:hypothetical protein
MTISNSTRPQGAFARALFYALQPMLLVGVIAAWYADPTNPNTYLIALLSVQVVLGFAELFFPARPTWTVLGQDPFAQCAYRHGASGAIRSCWRALS